MRAFFGVVLSSMLLQAFGATEVFAVPPSNVRVVKPGGSNSTASGAGETWGAAWGSLKFAADQLNGSSPTGSPPAFTEIWLATGSSGYAYTPDQDNTSSDDNEAVSILIEKGVTIRGGFAGTEDWEYERSPSNPRTKLSGDIDGSVNSYRLIRLLLEDWDMPVVFERIEFTKADGRPINQEGGAIQADWSGTNTQLDGPLSLENSALIHNSILWGNSADSANDPAEEQIAPLDSSGHSIVLDIAESCIQAIDTTYWIVGNIDVDPLFADPAAGNLRLKPCSSPVQDQGDESIRPTDFADLDGDGTTDLHPLDLDDKSRVQGAEVDMGAFELPCLADLDSSGLVDGADLGTLLGQWGTCTSFCSADFKCDGIVDGADLGILLGEWSNTCYLETPPPELLLYGGGTSASLDGLFVYLGVESVGAAGEVLGNMEYEAMVALLELFLGSPSSNES